MGNIMQSPQNDSDEDVVLDYGLLRGNKLERASMRQLTMDSNLNSAPNVVCQKDNLNIFHLDLDEEDKIELIYLLYTNCQDAYRDMLVVLQGNPINVIQKWLLTNENVNKEFLLKHVIEALATMQNYRVLKQLGYKKESLLNYLPNQKNISIHIDKHKKYFYRMFEDMDLDLETRFLNLVKQDMLATNFDFKEFCCLELYFTYFETINYIQRYNYSNILKHLKVLELDVHYNNIKIMQSSREDGRLPFHLNFDETMQQQFAGARQIQNLETIKRTVSRNEDCYPMDPDNPGVCLILDNEEFYTEFEEQYKDLVMQLDNKIESRKGTHYDSEGLEKIFKRLHYKVFLHRNKTHAEIKKIVLETCGKFKPEDSSFFIIFLSHGEEGKVLASNSIPLEIEDIKSWIYDFPILNKKPKVLIFQCCQGQKFHIDGLSDNNASNDLNKQKNPICRDGMDILELHSALPGFVSIRDENNGTWMIQSLCKILEEDTGEHLLDICIKVQRNVRSKEWRRVKNGVSETIKMVCEYKSTFEKKLYLPNFKLNDNNIY